MGKIFVNKLVQKHYWYCVFGTNNLTAYACDTIMIDHKQRFLTESIKSVLGIPLHINTFYDYQNEICGGYRSLTEGCLISLCSDIESFFKDLFSYTFPEESLRKNYFQRIDNVNLEQFSKLNINLNNSDSFENIKLLFQIRHIYIHNMEFVDDEFNTKTRLNLPLA